MIRFDLEPVELDERGTQDVTVDVRQPEAGIVDATDGEISARASASGA
jgi:hypothetical protein